MIAKGRLIDTLSSRLNGSLQSQNLDNLPSSLEGELFARLFWVLNNQLRIINTDQVRTQLFEDIR